MSESIPVGDGKKKIAENWDGVAHQNAQLEEAFTHRAAEFRQGIFQAYDKYFGDKDSASWVYFTIPSKPVPGEPSEYNTDREILIMRYQADESQIPVIRILTNETFGSTKEGNILSEDFILDHENDAQYFIDALALNDHVPQLSSLATIFLFSDDKLVLDNLRVFPVILDATKEEIGILPFGHFKNIEDKLDALDYGFGLLAEVKGLVPDRCSASQ